MRTARGLARLFEFEEFEDYFEILFGHAPTLRVAADLIAPRSPRLMPHTPQDHPKSPQDPTKTTQRPPKTPQRGG